MFNLVDEPWIPVRSHDGVAREVSLRELYRAAPQLEGLALEFPLEHVAVTRILVGVLQSALGGPLGINEKRRWLEGHPACADTIDEYLDKWHHRFELFDLDRPFMQELVPDEFALLPVAALRPDWGSGNNAALFDHRSDRAPEPVDPGMAGRALLVLLYYQPGGGQSKPFYRSDSPGSRAVTALVDGDDLWETLVANSPTLLKDDTARPIWERETDHAPAKEGTTPLGWLDRVTWRSRAVRLIRDDDGYVRHCRVHQHLKLVDGPPFDPFVPVRRREGKEPTFARASASRAMWRDAETILRGLVAKGPASTVVADAAELFEALDPPRFPRMRVVAQVFPGADAKIADIAHGRLPVSAALLHDEERLLLVGKLIERADVGTKALRIAIKVYADELGEGDGWGFARRWELPVWAALAGPFRDALAVIAQAAEPPQGGDAVVVDWLAAVRRECRAAFSTLASAASTSPRQTRALAHAHGALERGLSKITPGKEESR